MVKFQEIGRCGSIPFDIVGELTTFAPDMRGIWVRLTYKHAAHLQTRDASAAMCQHDGLAVPTGSQLRWQLPY
jgi:hypothetical protein